MGSTEHILTSLGTSQPPAPFGRYAFKWEKNKNVIRFYGGAQFAEVALCTEAGLNNVYTLFCNVVVGCIGQTGRKMR